MGSALTHIPSAAEKIQAIVKEVKRGTVKKIPLSPEQLHTIITELKTENEQLNNSVTNAQETVENQTLNRTYEVLHSTQAALNESYIVPKILYEEQDISWFPFLKTSDTEIIIIVQIIIIVLLTILLMTGACHRYREKKRQQRPFIHHTEYVELTTQKEDRNEIDL